MFVHILRPVSFFVNVKEYLQFNIYSQLALKRASAAGLEPADK